MSQVTVIISKSTYSQFRKTNPHLRWGQEFHQFMKFEKITSEPNKTWCDHLYYEVDEERAKAMVLEQMDFVN